MRTIYIIRHGERWDEVDKRAFTIWNDALKSKRKIAHRLSDSPLSENGHDMAEIMSQTMADVVIKDLKKVVIYCSRMHRAIQTAYRLAKKLNLPLCVSSGVSRIVAKTNNFIETEGSFDFLSMDEIREFCKGIEVKNVDGEVPTSGWLEALGAIGRRNMDTNTVSIVVAHRELPRKLEGYRAKTPHCCIYEYNVSNGGDATSDYKLVQARKQCGEVFDPKRK